MDAPAHIGVQFQIVANTIEPRVSRMKYLLLGISVLLLAVGCSKFEVYERNLQYMTMETYQSEKVLVGKEYQEAQLALAKAETSGNPEVIKKARATFNDAKAKARAIEWEDRRRNRTW